MESLPAFMYADFLGRAVWLWLLFAGVVITLLALDLGVLHKDDHEIGVRENLFLSGGYISMAALFGGWVWWYPGLQSSTEYFTGFLIEKSLSMDSVFVIAASSARFQRQFTDRDVRSDRWRSGGFAVEATWQGGGLGTQPFKI